jgi:CHAT domain-containing protein/tetratricopeptide (TPR) repeat protein
MKRYAVGWVQTIALLLTLTLPLSAALPSPQELLQQGNQQYQTGQLKAAIASWQQARDLYRRANNSQGEAQVLFQLGGAYVALERYREAVTTLEAYLTLARSLSNQLGEAEALTNLGIAYEALGKYGRALEAHRAAGRLMRSLNNTAGLGQVLLNLGNTFEAVGDYDNAQIAYEQSLKIVRQSGDRTGETIALNNLGAVYANLGNYERAIATLKSSLAIAQSNQNFASQASALINLGSAQHSLSIDPKGRLPHLRQAIQYYQQALKVAQQAGNRPRQGEALGSLGLAYEDLKQFAKAIDYYRKSLAIAVASGNAEAQGRALNNLGHALFKAGQLAAAETQLRQTIQLLDKLRPDLSDTYKVSIFDTQVHSYSLLQQILVAAHKYDAALEVAEQGRARAFAELLAQRVGGWGGGEGGGGREGGGGLSIQQIRQIARQQNATLVEYAIAPDDDFKFRGKQQAREAALFIWVVQPAGKISFRQVDLRPLWQKGTTLAGVVQLARCLSPGENCGAIARAIRPGESTPAPDSKTAARRKQQQPGLRKLHDLLIQPIADLLPPNPNAHIIFIPQDSLFLVPLGALQTPDGSYLIEQHTILTAPSIQILALTHQQTTPPSLSSPSPPPPPSPPSPLSPLPPPPSLVIGNPTMPLVSLAPNDPPQQLSPLPGAEQEAIAVANLLKTKALIGGAATKVAVKQQLPTAQIIHLATHGLLEYGTPAGHISLQGLGVPGAIALAPAPGDDGLLTANEILDLRLRANLVVLSACNTGQGRITGDGVIGLSRAFIVAGVPSVMVSLWAVPDAPTAALMTAFYRNLKQQPDKARALRLATLDILKRYPRPLDWAAFTLIGEAL